MYSDSLIAPEDLRGLYDEYEYCDIFYGHKNSIVSVVNGSFIERKNLIKTLDAVKIWDNKKSFQNQNYYKQTINKYQKLVPSLGNYSSEFKAFKAKINNSDLSAYCQFYFQESMVQYVAGSYTACVSFFGLSCEDLLTDLVKGCQNKYIYDNPSSTIEDWYVRFTSSSNHRRCAKNNLLALKTYFDSEKTYFGGNGFYKLNEMLVTFDVIRNYRNDADHPSDFIFEKEYCDRLFASLSIYIELIINLIKHLRATYP